MDIIKTRQKNWIGHILRGNFLQREIVEGRMEGKRGTGRPRQKLMDWMMVEEYGIELYQYNFLPIIPITRVADY